MICEPINELPQQIDLKEFSLEAQAYNVLNDKKHVQKINEDRIVETTLAYDIIPTSHSSDYILLKKVLSLRDNEYLSCKWDGFLDDSNYSAYPKIILYSDLKKRKIQPRKLTLNGQFYGVDNKLSPIPVMDDPRNLEMKEHKKLSELH